jgi:hypothetical protein
LRAIKLNIKTNTPYGVLGTKNHFFRRKISMKTKSRKRMLISSVAMLLVAMLALGTATFAWFTSSTVATAKGINVQTIKASELQISSATSDWGTLVNYGLENKTLLPASTANGTAWFKANAAVRTAFTADADTVASVSTDEAGSYYFKDQLNVRNNGAADVTDVTISFSVPNNYLRVALVETSAKGTGKANTGTFTTSVYDADGAAYNAYTSTSATTSITPKTTYTINIGTLSKDQAKYYNLYVWFEGQDVDCKDANAGAVIKDIEFTVSGTTDSNQ